MRRGGEAMRMKREAEEAVHCVTEGATPGRDRICEDLGRRGVPPEFAEALSQLLETRALGQSGSEYDAMLDGVAAAYGAERSTREELHRNLRELQELERLMGNFVGELSKLDEALEVLAAYVRRMRTNSARHKNQVLH